MINYPANKNYELWVRDSGEFDGFAVYVNNALVNVVGDQQTHKYPVEHPAAPLAITVTFGGSDGGVSAIVDVTDPNNQAVVEKQKGLKHSYLVG